MRRRLFHIGSFLLAAGLLYLAFRGIDVASISDAFRAADYRWLPVLVLLVIFSNLMRAWRWDALLEALPYETCRSEPDAEPEVRTRDSFASIMIGYMVNYAAPRMGEVARTANMSARSKLNFSSVFGTVVVERIFDTVVLGAAILSAGILLIDRMPIVWDTFIAPAVSRFEALPATTIVLWTAVSLVVLGVVGYGLWRWARNEQSALHQVWTQTIQPALVSFKDGMLTLQRSDRRVTIAVSTVGMWFGYLLMAYIPFRMLGIAFPYDIGLVDAWILMAIGALGLLVPSPGGLGSYHYITIQALVLLYDVPEGPAASYAVLTHAAQLVFYTVIGLMALVWQGSSLGSLFRRAPSNSPDEQASSPDADASDAPVSRDAEPVKG